ncbi:hypothetical protein LWI28_006075 [Acer negundo]|uniref:Uncharacterized protein n=1 Tax=Acer negundo TaxID=4023 RepID=A0AAD5NYK4_ACENE|nr:hypothetical protein LWI28_006075 [Acer negundo]
MQACIEGKNCIVTGANLGIGYATAEGSRSRSSGDDGGSFLGLGDVVVVDRSTSGGDDGGSVLGLGDVATVDGFGSGGGF